MVLSEGIIFGIICNSNVSKMFVIYFVFNVHKDKLLNFIKRSDRFMYVKQLDSEI